MAEKLTLEPGTPRLRKSRTYKTPELWRWMGEVAREGPPSGAAKAPRQQPPRPITVFPQEGYTFPRLRPLGQVTNLQAPRGSRSQPSQ